MAHKNVEPNQPSLNAFSIKQPAVLVAYDKAMIPNLVAIPIQRGAYLVLSSPYGQQAVSHEHPGIVGLVIAEVGTPRLESMDLCTQLLKERRSPVSEVHDLRRRCNE